VVPDELAAAPVVLAELAAAPVVLDPPDVAWAVVALPPAVAVPAADVLVVGWVTLLGSV